MHEGDKLGYMAAVLRQEDEEHPEKFDRIKGYVATKKEMLRGPYEDQYFPDGDVYPITDTRWIASRKPKPRVNLHVLFQGSNLYPILFNMICVLIKIYANSVICKKIKHCRAILISCPVR